MDDSLVNDTIYAPATPAGRSALAIVRMSGPRVSDVITAMCGKLPEPRKLSRCDISAQDGDKLDSAMVVFLPGPNSPTGEDVGEFHLHGSPYIIGSVCEALSELGLRIAEPGEFTRRAVLAGKMDLAQAEGLADLVDAETPQQRRQAIYQLYGSISNPVVQWRDRLLDALALCEAVLDFSDEGDIDEESVIRAARSVVNKVERELSQALKRSDYGERVREGFRVVLAGPPNAGKSTLLNTIAGRDVAIVSHIPGTTRDVVEVRISLAGHLVRLVDTAGLRESGDLIEQIGVSRSQQEIANADVVIFLVAPQQQSELMNVTLVSDAPVLRVLSQADTLSSGEVGTALGLDVRISAVTGEGIGQLLELVREKLPIKSMTEGITLTRIRHRNAVQSAVAHVRRADDLMACGEADARLVLASEEIRLAVRELGAVTGHVNPDMVLDRLFSSFCIGK